MTSVKSSKLLINYQHKNVGGTYRLQVVYRDAIAININPFQHFDKSIKFMYSEQYLINEYAQILKVEHSLSNAYANRTLKVIFDVSTNVDDFQKWFNENLLNRIVSLVLTDENEEVEVIHFMKAIDFIKASTSQRNTPKTIEIQFVPTKIKPENLLNNFEPILEIEKENKLSLLTAGGIEKKVEVKIILKDFVEKSYIKLLYSESPNIENATSFNYISNLKTGTYYLFAVCIASPQNVQRYKLEIDTEAESNITLI